MLLQGQEMESLWKTSGRRQRTIYCGDGANDLCPALRLGPQDVVLARKVGRQGGIALLFRLMPLC